jgi:hypothetical protein
MSNSTLRKEEEQSFKDEDHEQPIPPKEVVAYNELRSCADLFRMYKNGKLEIQPDFQREVVWKQNERSRFIDSLVKQLPIPSMCFSLDSTTQTWKVIDGLQRMSSIIAFFSDKPWEIAKLDDIHPLLRGEKNVTLKNGTDDQKRLYASVEDMSIPITVIRCDYKEKLHMRYLYMIFNRLNSGGVRLNNQEIRNCIYSGNFNNMLKEFDNNNDDWRIVKKSIWGSMARFKSVEILLRALAFSNDLQSYNGNLAGYLNDYMDSASRYDLNKIEKLEKSLSFMAKSARKVLNNMYSGKKSITFIEGLLVGLLDNHEKYELLKNDQLDRLLNENSKKYQSLPSFMNVQRYAVSSESIVKNRLSEAKEFFSSIN